MGIQIVMLRPKGQVPGTSVQVRPDNESTILRIQQLESHIQRLRHFASAGHLTTHDRWQCMQRILMGGPNCELIQRPLTDAILWDIAHELHGAMIDEQPAKVSDIHKIVKRLLCTRSQP